jgi:predicted ATP pyrophosphatase (TIGR00289 family)
MKVACLFSGGKDSTLAAFLMSSNGYEPFLVTFLPEKKHSYMLHGEALNLTSLQAKAMGMKHYTFPVSGLKDKEVDEMLEHFKHLKNKERFEAICSGAVESEYQKQRIEYIGNELGLIIYTPLWKRFSLLNAYNEMEIIITKVSASGFSKEDLGKKLNEIKIKEQIHPFFEGGEAETAVIDAPFFNGRIEILEKIIEWHKDWGELIVKKAILNTKY